MKYENLSVHPTQSTTRKKEEMYLISKIEKLAKNVFFRILTRICIFFTHMGKQIFEITCIIFANLFAFLLF